MESLVADNKALKRDIAELQNLLTEYREDVRLLREEVEESKANMHPMTEGTEQFCENVSWRLKSFGRPRERHCNLQSSKPFA